MKILIIDGSHRKGNTHLLIQELVNEFKTKGLKVNTLVLREIEIKIPDGCGSCGESKICPNMKDQFSEDIEPTIRDYDLYIIATPTWSDNVTPLTKIFWDRIVSWCAEEKMYLKGKKLAIVTHGMADKKSWKFPISWARSICRWEKCNFAGSLTFNSGSKIGSIKIDKKKLRNFIQKILKPL